MPPEDVLKSRVSFFYTRELGLTPDKFWKEAGKEWNGTVEKFVGHRKTIDDEVSRLVKPEDSAETKLRKLYARTLAGSTLCLVRAPEKRRRTKARKPERKHKRRRCFEAQLRLWQ